MPNDAFEMYQACDETDMVYHIYQTNLMRRITSKQSPISKEKNMRNEAWIHIQNTDMILYWYMDKRKLGEKNKLWVHLENIFYICNVWQCLTGIHVLR